MLLSGALHTYLTAIFAVIMHYNISSDSLLQQSHLQPLSQNKFFLTADFTAYSA